jgi:hypothetical protein
MKTKRLFVVLIACGFLFLQCGIADSAVRLDWSSLSLSERAALMNALIIDKIEYRQVTLRDVLKDLSKRCRSALGRGFSISDQNASKGRLAMPVTLNLTDMNMREVLTYVGRSVDASVTMTEHGFVIRDKEPSDSEK